MVEDLDLALKLVFALALGGLIGLEREVHKKTAGLRTHMIVCLSSALLMVLSIDVPKGTGYEGDPTRIAAGVMTGIGFLGAGTIIKHGTTVQGLTTAASIWTAAAVGLAVGAGYFMSATLVVLLTLVTLITVQKADTYLHIYKRRATMVIHLEAAPGSIQRLHARFDELRLEVGEFSVDKRWVQTGTMVVQVQLFDTGGKDRSDVAAALLDTQGVLAVEFF